MEDKLRKYIQQHKDSFDELEPDAALWEGISTKLPKKSKEIAWKVWLSRAAVILVAMSVGFLIARQGNFSSQEVKQEAVADFIPKEVQDAEKYYLRLINQRMEEIHSIDQQGDIYQEIAKDIEILDTMYEELKNKLRLQVNEEQITDAMIQNLQMRIEILNRQLEILEKVKNSKKQNEYEI